MNIFLNKQTHIHISLNVIFSNDYSVSNCNDEANGGITQETIMIYASERLSSSGLIGDDGKFTAPIAGAYEFKIYSRTVSTLDYLIVVGYEINVALGIFPEIDKCSLLNRCLMVSTNQADPSCFYFRIS